MVAVGGSTHAGNTCRQGNEILYSQESNAPPPETLGVCVCMWLCVWGGPGRPAVSVLHICVVGAPGVISSANLHTVIVRALMPASHATLPGTQHMRLPLVTSARAGNTLYRFCCPCVPPARDVYRLQVADMQYNTLANGHGPIIRYNVEELVGDYKKWSLAVEKGATQVGPFLFTFFLFVSFTHRGVLPCLSLLVCGRPSCVLPPAACLFPLSWSA